MWSCERPRVVSLLVMQRELHFRASEIRNTAGTTLRVDAFAQKSELLRFDISAQRIM